MIGWALRQAVIWGGVGLLAYAVVGYRLVAPPDAAPPPAPATASHTVVPNVLTFRAGRDGHVELDAVVNGAPVRFLVDTGATMVVLSLRDAAAAGIGRNSLDFTMRTQTANGVGRAAPVKLRELRIGQFSAVDVPAAVVENLRISLLGQSFLQRLDSYEMRDGVLTLHWR